ncbi:hypothetical protein KQX54_016318 [Cotesia glomerata]|uniref:Uncharacterized protein n=1 Tax=Cotesia glomerata TaxID=32391 RepID=A0AAV7I9M8_COTGL|nr:hypothetical protein KQX54_016318 [Cotesia glomerata]
MSRSTARISSWFTIIQLLVAESQQWSMFNMWPGFGQYPLEWSNHQNIQNQQIQPRVLNFFPVPVEEECRSEDQRRRGICMNTYECRIQQGKSHGPCALGFGVCCVCKFFQIKYNIIHRFVPRNSVTILTQELSSE